jgi:predicted RNase H-like nuclease
VLPTRYGKSDCESGAVSAATPSELIGVDGCRDGWVIAKTDEHLNGLCFRIMQPVGELFERANDQGAVIAIDVPIGLPKAGARTCDLAARRALGPRQGSRVFPAPSRLTLAGSTYLECCDLNRTASGVAISKQAHAILPKIRDVDRAVTPDRGRFIREVHPEVIFCTLKGEPLMYSKKTSAGRSERLAILWQHGLAFDPIAERLRLGRSRLTIDDLIDAAVCLLTAHKVHLGVEGVLGDARRDGRGLLMNIAA